MRQRSEPSVILVVRRGSSVSARKPDLPPIRYVRRLPGAHLHGALPSSPALPWRKNRGGRPRASRRHLLPAVPSCFHGAQATTEGGAWGGVTCHKRGSCAGGGGFTPTVLRTISVGERSGIRKKAPDGIAMTQMTSSFAIEDRTVGGKHAPHN